MTREFYDMLIRNAADATQRARWVLTVAVVISLMQLGPVYSFSYGQLRSFVERLVYDKKRVSPKDVAANPPVQGASASPTALARSPEASAALSELQKEAIKAWVEQQSVAVGALGIRFHATDASLIGSFAFVIVTVWLFYAARRENHLFGRILQMAEPEAPRMRAYVFHALNSTQLFSTLSEDDAPFSSAEFIPVTTVAHEAVGRVDASGPGGEAKRAGTKPKSYAFGVRPLAAALTYLPVLTLTCMILADLASVFTFNAVFRGFEGSINEYNYGRIFEGNASFWLLLVLECLALAFVWYLCIRIHRLQLGTQQLLRDARPWEGTSPGPDPEITLPRGSQSIEVGADS